jgi:hypothetical protein
MACPCMHRLALVRLRLRHARTSGLRSWSGCPSRSPRSRWSATPTRRPIGSATVCPECLLFAGVGVNVYAPMKIAGPRFLGGKIARLAHLHRIALCCRLSPRQPPRSLPFAVPFAARPTRLALAPTREACGPGGQRRDGPAGLAGRGCGLLGACNAAGRASKCRRRRPARPPRRRSRYGLLSQAL